MPGYYTDKLSAGRLRSCYELAPPKTRAYLEAEIDFVLPKTSSGMVALELGCGYGESFDDSSPECELQSESTLRCQALGMAVEFVGSKRCFTWQPWTRRAWVFGMAASI